MLFLLLLQKYSFLLFDFFIGGQTHPKSCTIALSFNLALLGWEGLESSADSFPIVGDSSEIVLLEIDKSFEHFVVVLVEKVQPPKYDDGYNYKKDYGYCQNSYQFSTGRTDLFDKFVIELQLGFVYHRIEPWFDVRVQLSKLIPCPIYSSVGRKRHYALHNHVEDVDLVVGDPFVYWIILIGIVKAFGVDSFVCQKSDRLLIFDIFAQTVGSEDHIAVSLSIVAYIKW